MIDVEEFTRRFRDRLIAVAAESRGVSGMEAFRVYNTNPDFKAQVETIVMAAVQVLRGIEIEPDNRLSEIFSQEANALLGWDDDAR